MDFKLKQMRVERGLSQRDFSKQIGKSFRTIQMWENGDSYPNAEMLWRLCEFFSTDPNTMLGWYDEHPRESPPDLTRDERELVGCYREATEGRKSALMISARDHAAMSKDAPCAGGQAAVSEAV